MWEAYGMEDENFLWAGIPFMGGICGENKATCGAVSAAAVTLGLYHRTPLADKQKAKTARNLSRKQTGQLVKEFIDTFGHVNCQDLLSIDFSVPGAYLKFRSSGIAEKKCYQYVYFLIEKLYGFANDPGPVLEE